MLLPNYLSIEIQGVPQYTDDGEPFVRRGWVRGTTQNFHVY